MNDLKKYLDEMMVRFETPSFIEQDPVQFPRRYQDKMDIEVAALLTSIIAWGNRKQIINDCNKMFALMGQHPFRYVMDGGWCDLNPNINIHRTFFGRDLIYICQGLEYFYHRGFTLQNIKHEDVWQWCERFQMFMVKDNGGEYNKHITPNGGNHASHKGQSPFKRLNLFLRWMVRTGSPVDLGLWTENFTPASLIIPLDVHVGRIARELGIVERKSNDRITAEIITDKLRDFDINDPCKYDFALFGIGESQKHVRI
jgi:uncharacterized protein (TIGR02757 family)